MWERVKLNFIIRIHNTKESFFFNSIYRIWFEMFLDIGFASLYNLYEIKWENYIDVYSNIVIFIWIFIFTIAIFGIPFVYCQVSRNKSRNHRRVQVLFDDFKKGKNIWVMDYFVFFIRRLVLILVIILRWKHGKLQVIIFFIACIFVLIWKISIRPFQNQILNFQDSVFEVFLWIIVAIYFRFTKESTELASSGTPHILGIICLVLIIWMMILNFMVTAHLTIQRWRNVNKIKQISDINTIKNKIISAIKAKNVILNSEFIL